MRNVRIMREIGIAESISGDKFATESRINVLTAHAQTLSSQKSLKIVSRALNDSVFIRQEDLLMHRNRASTLSVEII